MVRTFAAAAITLTGLAIAGAAPALSAPLSSGMSADFPVGSCIDLPSQVLNADGNFTLNEAFNLEYLASVPCTDPNRNYRVTAQVPHADLCGPETNRSFVTKDVVVLCAVQDPAPVFGG